MMYRREDQIQIACVNWFTYSYPELFLLLYHAANEGDANSARGSRMKAMGVKRGVPDLILNVSRHGYHSLGIELKTEKGKQSSYQKEFEKVFTAEGNLYKICRSLDEFIQLCKWYLGDPGDPNKEALRKILEYKSNEE